MLDDSAISEFAASHAAGVAAVRALVDTLAAQAGAVDFYIFWIGGGGRAAQPSGARARTLLAFATPDAALAFAQQNGLGGASERPRLRRLTLLQLFHAMLQEPAIGALILAGDTEHAPLAAGRLPPGVRLERAELVRRLSETGEAVI